MVLVSNKLMLSDAAVFVLGLVAVTDRLLRSVSCRCDVC